MNGGAHCGGDGRNAQIPAWSSIREFITLSAMPELFYRLPQNVITIFRGRNLWWHALAIVLTIIMVESGGDWRYYLWFHESLWVRAAFPAMLLGGLMPIFGTLLILLVGEVAKNRRVVTTAWALGQAAILGSLISSTYKAFTGRRPPPFSNHFLGESASSSLLTDTSHGFRLGLLHGGVFWGWPSSHTTIAFAMAICLVALYPRNKRLVIIALLYALYIGIGVSITIHWLSEFVAGAIIGSVIGVTVGRSFKTRLDRLATPLPG